MVVVAGISNRNFVLGDVISGKLYINCFLVFHVAQDMQASD